jgi:hypothetical protein
MAAGLQVPVIPFVDVPVNVGTVAPMQIDREFPKLNVGVNIGFTVTVNVAVDIHGCEPEGVNVYIPEFWLLTTAGLHTPVIPFVDVASNAGTVPPVQMVIVVPKLNVGVIIGFTVTVKLVVVAH